MEESSKNELTNEHITTEDELDDASRSICGSMLAFNILAVIFSDPLTFLVIVPAITAFMPEQGDPITYMDTSYWTFLLNIVVTILTTWVIWHHHKKRHDIKLPFVKLRFCDKNIIIKYTILGLGLSAMGSLFVNIMTLMLNQVGLDLTTPDFTMKPDLTFNIVLLINTLLVAPILEELLYRGLIMHYLQRFSNLFACVITSLIFGLMHGNLIQAIPVFFLSMTLCIIRIKTGSLYAPMIMHFINNLIATIGSYVFEGPFGTVFIVLEWCALIYALSYLIKKRKKIHTLWKGIFPNICTFFFCNWKAVIFSIFSILSLLGSIATL